MISAVILTKDRACQLHLLLESIARNAPHLFDSLQIIWKASNKYYDSGYAKLREELSSGELKILDGQTSFIPEQPDGLINTMVTVFRGVTTPYICGWTDDCVMFRGITHQPSEIAETMEDPDVFCFTLRMGLNTIVQNYITGEKQPPLTNYQTNGDMVKWVWRNRGYYNFGYPWTCDAHIYRKDELLSITVASQAKSLREWEGKTVSQGLRGVGNKMASFSQSAVICLANNCVQNPPMIAGVKHAYSAWDLNELYLQGQAIDIAKLGLENVVSCHTEAPFSFRQR